MQLEGARFASQVCLPPPCAWSGGSKERYFLPEKEHEEKGRLLGFFLVHL